MALDFYKNSYQRPSASTCLSSCRPFSYSHCPRWIPKRSLAKKFHVSTLSLLSDPPPPVTTCPDSYLGWTCVCRGCDTLAHSDWVSTPQWSARHHRAQPANPPSTYCKSWGVRPLSSPIKQRSDTKHQVEFRFLFSWTHPLRNLFFCNRSSSSHRKYALQRYHWILLCFWSRLFDPVFLGPIYFWVLQV